MTKKNIIISTGNKGKLDNFCHFFHNYNIGIITLHDLGIKDDYVENGVDFTTNALIKSLHVMKYNSSYPVLSDDSGLLVHGLHGRPGVYSARLAGKRKDFRLAQTEIYRDLTMQHIDDWSASLVCSLCCLGVNGYIGRYTGKVDGKIIYPPKNSGWGYNSFFKPYTSSIENNYDFIGYHRFLALQDFVSDISNIW